MAQQAYICLHDDLWALAVEDDGQEVILVVGRPFQPGADIREATAELEAWAWENGYELTIPTYAAAEWSLEDLIEPEVFDEVFGADAQDEP